MIELLAFVIKKKNLVNLFLDNYNENGIDKKTKYSISSIVKKLILNTDDKNIKNISRKFDINKIYSGSEIHDIIKNVYNKNTKTVSLSPEKLQKLKTHLKKLIL